MALRGINLKRPDLRRLDLRAIGIALALLSGTASVEADTCLRGVNLSGAEFGDMPGRPAYDYAYPDEKNVAYYAKLGMSAVRLPFRWERLQPDLKKPLDEGELKRLDESTAIIKAAGMVPILDLHNFGYYNKKQIGTPDVPVAALAHVWRALAEHFRGEPDFVFSIMNEPYDIPAHDWAKTTNEVIAAIRATGSKNFILASGTAWGGAHSWSADLPTGNNAKEMLAVKDSLDRYAFDFHQYLDGNFSGTSPECPAADKALSAIGDVTQWLKENKKRGFLGEFAASEKPQCLSAMLKMIGRVDAEPATWVGWTLWGGGVRWPQDYMFNLEPTPEGDRLGLKLLVMHGPLAHGKANSCDLSSHAGKDAAGKAAAGGKNP